MLMNSISVFTIISIMKCFPIISFFLNSISVFTVLKDLKYADSHEWVKVDGTSATIGITDHAQVSIFPH